MLALGIKPTIPAFVGDGMNSGPPPLPYYRPGNPFFIASDGSSFASNDIDLKSLEHSEKSLQNRNSNDERKKFSSLLKGPKPHPSIIKSLLDCADDVLVECYASETVGDECGIEEKSNTSSVQVSIFSSQLHRQFIVCFRGSLMEHANPVKPKTVLKSSSGGMLLYVHAFLSSSNRKTSAYLQQGSMHCYPA